MIKYGNKSSTSKVSRRFVKRTARRVPRPIRNTGMSMKVEYDDQIYFANGTKVPLFLYTAASYFNFQDILVLNPAFVAQTNNYIRYKITGCTVTCTPVFTETGLNTAFGLSGAPVCFIQQYPQLQSQSVGSECEFSDNNLMVKPLSLTQSKYWTYKNNYLTGFTVGTWNQCNLAASNNGQFSVISPTNQSNAGAAIVMYAIRLALYVMLDGKAR